MRTVPCAGMVFALSRRCRRSGVGRRRERASAARQCRVERAQLARRDDAARYLRPYFAVNVALPIVLAWIMKPIIAPGAFASASSFAVFSA
jgi:hypothetical protein